MASLAEPPAKPIVPKRAPPRSRVYLVAWLHSNGATEQVRIRDLSRSGALVEATASPPVGSIVRLVRGRATLEARVAWSDSTWFGVEFSQRLEDGFLVDQLSPQLKVSAPRWYRREHLEQAAAEDPQ
jgi:hypothetical protein